ncbi:MAG: TfoX/Sxy family DNA transformation protein [Pseudomonadota bacterium]
MGEPITTIRNLGPAMADAFAAVGISSADALRDLGADDAYARLVQNGTRPHFIAYYALVMGLQGRPWNDCKGKEKDDLRRRFEAIKSQTKPDKPAGIEHILNQIGVVERRK